MCEKNLIARFAKFKKKKIGIYIFVSTLYVLRYNGNTKCSIGTNDNGKQKSLENFSWSCWSLSQVSCSI